MRYEGRQLKKNEKVKIFDASGKEYLGIGLYKGDKPYVVAGMGKVNNPFFEVKNKIIYGYQCWWIPLKEAEEIENEVRSKYGNRKGESTKESNRRHQKGLQRKRYKVKRPNV